MKSSVLLATLFALASIPVLAQPPYSSPATPPAASPASPQSEQQPPGAPGTSPEAQPPETQPASPSQQEASPSQPDAASAAAAPSATQVADMRPVDGQLVSKLDTRTAKTGDDVVIETRGSVKTADGTEIPKGSKLMGHVIAVQPSAAGANSQVALNIDRAELKGGQTLPIHSEIQSIGSSSSEGSASESSAPSAMTRPAPESSPGSSASGASPGMGGGSQQQQSAAAPGYAPGYTPGTTGSSSGGPAAGTIVARNGHIAIRTTSVPGVLLANNAPGEQDPRMTQASGILLGAKKDVQLDTGTRLVIGVAASQPGAQGAEPQPQGGAQAAAAQGAGSQ